MQSENFDDIIKQRIEQRPEGIDKPGWEKMETLLDKHLPQKKDDRRRIILFLLLFLVAGGGAFLIWQNNAGKNEKLSANTKTVKEPSLQNQPLLKPETGITTPDEKSNSKKNNAEETAGNIKKEVPETPATKNIFDTDEVKERSVAAFTLTAPAIEPKKKNKPVTGKPGTNETIFQKTTPVVTEKEIAVVKKEEETNQKEQSAEQIIQAEEIKKEIKEEEQPLQAPPAETKQPELEKDSAEQTEIPAVAKKKNKNGFGNKLFFTVSAGPDLSTVGLDKTGKVKPVYGAGIGYQLTKKIAIRTGFYTTHKVYAAGPEDYDPPANFWSYYPNLKTIDADCKVYEIPLAVDFLFAGKQSGNWFASAGLSTLLMKKETYEYYFKPSYSPNYITYIRVHENENKHFFSILNLSGGYRRTLNKTISLQAEPYLKIATSGIGYGKVKLNSGGILFSAIIKPFASNK